MICKSIDILISAIDKACKKINSSSHLLCDRPLPLAHVTFDGSQQSFEVACLNTSSCHELQIYGLHTIDMVLKCLHRAFHIFELWSHKAFVLSHYGHLLLKIENTTAPEDSPILYADIADIIDQSPSSIASSSLKEIVKRVEEQEFSCNDRCNQKFCECHVFEDEVEDNNEMQLNSNLDEVIIENYYDPDDKQSMLNRADKRSVFLQGFVFAIMLAIAAAKKKA